MTRKTNIEFDDVKPKFMNQENRWNDAYIGVNFAYEGKDYFITLVINEGTLMGRSANRLKVNSGPLTLKTDGDIQVLEKQGLEVDQVKLQREPSFTHRIEENKVIMKQEELTAILKVDEQKIISKNEIIKGELIARPRGPVFWWGNEKNTPCEVTEGTRVFGIESLSDVTGKLIINGKEIEVNGRGLYEHVWIDSLRFMKIRLEDWVYANFDQLYTFFCHAESISNDGSQYHYETGTIYIPEEDDYLITKKIEVSPENWIYVKWAHRFMPRNLKIKVNTDKGRLKMKTDLAMYPQFIGRPRRIDQLTIQNIKGWNLMHYDAPLKIEGKFFYKNGKTIKLTNGTGVNEQLRIFPLY